MSPQERYKIAMNIIARAGGLENVDLRAELGRAESFVQREFSEVPQDQPPVGGVAQPPGVNSPQGEGLPIPPENMV